MKVLYACTELFPLLKTGGLGDVSGALPPALREAGCDVRVLLPGFTAIRNGIGPSELAHGGPIRLPARYGPDLASHGLPASPPLVQGTLPGSGLAAYVLDVPAFFDRPGNPYTDGRGDNAVRFGLARMGRRVPGAWARSGLAARHRALQRLAYRPRAGVPAADGDARAAARGDGVHRPQPGLPGHLPAVGVPAAGLARLPVRNQRHRVLGPGVVHEGRPAVRRPHHHGQPHLCAGNPRPRTGLRSGWPAARARGRRVGHPQRRGLQHLEPCQRWSTGPALRHRFAGEQGQGQGGPSAPAGPGPAPGCDAVRRGEPPDRAEGPEPGGGRRGRAGAHGRPAGGARRRRRAAGARFPARGWAERRADRGGHRL